MVMPCHVPTAFLRQQVEAMAAYGVPERDIGQVLGISARTLRKYYAEELANGHVRATVAVAKNLYRMATDPNGGHETLTAAIFWLRTRGRWSTGASMARPAADDEPD